MIEFVKFVTESNRIEGITRDPTKDEIEATIAFTELPAARFTPGLLEALVVVFQPNALMRDQYGRNVQVSDHVPPIGAPERRYDLENILAAATGGEHPWLVHNRYLTLHPFTDGNGRSGRALWLWQMLNQDHGHFDLSRGFLRQFYIQTLQFNTDR